LEDSPIVAYIETLEPVSLKGKSQLQQVFKLETRHLGGQIISSSMEHENR